MHIRDTEQSLRHLFGQVCAVCEGLTGEMPEYKESWYKVGTPILVWFRLIGPKARKNPRNSILFAVEWHKDFDEIGIPKGDDWFGGPESSNLIVRASSHDDFAILLRYLAIRYRILNTGSP